MLQRDARLLPVDERWPVLRHFARRADYPELLCCRYCCPRGHGGAGTLDNAAHF